MCWTAHACLHFVWIRAGGVEESAAVEEVGAVAEVKVLRICTIFQGRGICFTA